MIKNIIFDLDDTLILNSEEYLLSYKDVLKNLNYNPDDYEYIYDAMDEYEKNALNENKNLYNKNEMLAFLNKNLNKNYSIELIDEINIAVGKYWTKYPLVKKTTLDYLKQKYHLYVFTNWFRDAQVSRLQNIGILDYFDNVFASDYYGAKPFKSSYLNVIKHLNCLPEECVMIGDSKEKDVIAAINSGLHAILFDYNKNKDISDINIYHYSVINDLQKLEILF